MLSIVAASCLLLSTGCVTAAGAGDLDARGAPPVGTSASVPTTALHADLQRLEESKWDPAGSADREAFLTLFAEDFVSVEYGSDVQGGVHRRTRADVFSGPPAPASRYELSDWHFIQVDEHVVITSYRVNGLSFPWQAYAMSVWTLRDGRWVTVFSQVSTAE